MFNCGIGMILVIPHEQSEEMIARLHGLGERAYRIGEIERIDPADESRLVFDPGFLQQA